MTRAEPTLTRAKVASAAFTFAVAGGLVAWAVARLDTFGLHFPAREALAGLVAGSIATLGLRRTAGVYAACAVGFVGIAFATPVMLVSLQASSGDTNLDTITWFALCEGCSFAVLGAGLGLAIGRATVAVGVPVAACGALGGVVMAMPFTSFRPRDEPMETWIVVGLVGALATAGAWTGYVFARRGETRPKSQG